MLLASGVIKRPGFYSGLLILVGGAGIRSMIENILDRVRTLVLLDAFQQNAGGNIEARRRRRKTLTKKARVLIVHMLGIAATNIFIPLTIFIFESVNSSTKMLINLGAGYTVMSVLLVPGCITMHKHVNMSCAREAVNDMRAETSETTKENVYTVADESGLSAVGVSEVSRGKQNANLSSGGGLFSDVESD
jgi:hypothetical protein